MLSSVEPTEITELGLSPRLTGSLIHPPLYVLILLVGNEYNKNPINFILFKIRTKVFIPPYYLSFHFYTV